MSPPRKKTPDRWSRFGPPSDEPEEASHVEEAHEAHNTEQEPRF